MIHAIHPLIRARRPCFLLSILFAAVIGNMLYAQPQQPFQCRFVDSPIRIDGRADEAAWKDALVIDRFALPWLEDAPAVRAASRVRLLWDRQYLYFAADLEDADLFADVKEHDGPVWTNDSIALFLKPAADRGGCYEFHVNAAGTVLDLFNPVAGKNGYERFRSAGEFHIEAKVARQGTLDDRQDRDTGWSMEARIPWSDFLRAGGRPNPGERWKFAVGRYDYSANRKKPEISTCVPLLRPDFHDTENYGDLEFIGPAGTGKRIALTTSRVVGSPDPPPPFRIKKLFPKLNLSFPVGMVHQPGSDRLLVIHSARSSGASTISRMKDDQETSELEPLLKLEDIAYDIVFHPQFKDNGYFYIGSNGPQAGPREQRYTRVTRYTMDRTEPCKVDEKSALVIIEWWSDGHNGGAVAFGHDGMLYITSGDGTSDSDTNIVGQDMSSLLAKVLRIDVDHPEEGKNYAVPKDNPFLKLAGARPEIWAVGLRNPWRMTVDKKNGHLWVAQNGQDLWEQAYLVKKGDNYGWSVMEGSYPFYANRKLAPAPLVKPTVEHHHSEARSLTGGIVYYGTRFPELNGAYIYGDYSTGKVWGVRHDGAKILWHRELADTRLQITGFAADSHGELLIADHRGDGAGAFYTFEPSPPDDTAAKFPRKLSESGLFRSVKGHEMEPALIPYDVIAPLWGDHAFKQRWLGLPGETRLDFNTRRSFNLPDQTVIVKSFGLEMEEGNPASRRWIETRFLTNQKGEWHGYSYAWNDEQTDGVLVESKGADRVFAIKHADGIRKQIWHFPSRTECMVCHSRAANWVLGLSAVQMSPAQMRAFEPLGIFKIDWASDARTGVRDRLKNLKMTDKQIQDYLRQNATATGQRQPEISPLFARDLESYERLVDPYDTKADINLRARSYLHSNCAQCHVEAGGGNSQFNVDFFKASKDMKLIDAVPLHDAFGVKNAKIVAPGHPESSVLLQRMMQRGRGQMPPLATSLVDEAAVKMLRQWIEQLEAP